MIELDIQYACSRRGVPAAASFRRFAAAVPHRGRGAAVLRVVAEEEGRALNEAWRGKRGPTNVLSFRSETPPGVKTAHLGDLVICAPVVLREARDQGKDPAAHWAHMTVHGLLHLLGHDHATEAEAARMESLESRILARLGYANPYEQESTGS